MDKCTILHTFKLREMFLTFDVKALKITKTEILKYFKDGNKRDFAISVFKVSLEKVIDDIIDKGIQFQFQDSGKDISYLQLQRITGQEYVKLRKRGALKDFDPVDTNFNAYRIEYRIERKNNTVSTIPVHLNTGRTKRIASLASQHKIKVGPVRTYQDYYEFVAEKYPTLDRYDIYRILRYGFNSFRLHLSYGGDVFVQNKTFVLQTGRIYTNWALMIRYVMEKMAIKSRVLYKRLHYLWDGWSYFSLTHDKYEAIKRDFHAGKEVNFGKVALYKCYDEAIANSFNRTALFRVKSGDTETKFLTMTELTTDKAELIEIFHDWTWDTLRLSTRTYMTLFPKDVSIQQVYRNNYQPYIDWLRERRWKLLKK